MDEIQKVLVKAGRKDLAQKYWDKLAANNGTFKCPECGSKVLENTGYCVKCKKKVEQASKKKLTAKVDLKTLKSNAKKISTDVKKHYQSVSKFVKYLETAKRLDDFDNVAIENMFSIARELKNKLSLVDDALYELADIASGEQDERYT